MSTKELWREQNGIGHKLLSNCECWCGNSPKAY